MRLELSTFAHDMLARSERPTGLGRGGEDVVALDMGEPDFATPALVVEAGVSALTNGHTHYAPLQGNESLKWEIAARQRRLFGSNVDADQVVVTHGGSGGLTATILALINPGDRVVIPEPTYSLYADLVRLAGGEVVWVSTTGPDWLASVALRDAVMESKLMILCSPGNPTGSVLSQAQWDQIGELMKVAPRLAILSDEAYADITYGDSFVSCLSAGLPAGRIICCGTLSKSYAMTGWRLGYVIADSGVASHIRGVHARMTGALSTFGQLAGEVAVRSCDEQVREMRKVFEARRDLVLERLGVMPRVQFDEPEGAFYVFPYVETSLSSADMTKRLREHGVGVRSGSEYGPSGEGAVRLSFAASEATLDEGLRRLGAALSTFP